MTKNGSKRHAAMEAAYLQTLRSCGSEPQTTRGAGSLALPLTKFETEVIELESPMRQRKRSFAFGKTACRWKKWQTRDVIPFRRTDFLLEDLDAEAQQRFLSVGNGQLLEPIQRGDGFELCRVIKRIEPQADDPGI